MFFLVDGITIREKVLAWNNAQTMTALTFMLSSSIWFYNIFLLYFCKENHGGELICLVKKS